MFGTDLTLHTNYFLLQIDENFWHTFRVTSEWKSFKFPTDRLKTKGKNLPTLMDMIIMYCKLFLEEVLVGLKRI